MAANVKNPELIDAVRRCAEAGMSANQAAAATGLPSRNAAIGLAHRNGIKFSSDPSCPVDAVRMPKIKRAPKPVTHKPKPAAVTGLALHVVRAKSDNWKTKPPGLRCSWASCEREAEPGDMFCFGHTRMPLMLAR